PATLRPYTTLFRSRPWSTRAWKSSRPTCSSRSTSTTSRSSSTRNRTSTRWSSSPTPRRSRRSPHRTCVCPSPTLWARRRTDRRRGWARQRCRTTGASRCTGRSNRSTTRRSRPSAWPSTPAGAAAASRLCSTPPTRCSWRRSSPATSPSPTSTGDWPGPWRPTNRPPNTPWTPPWPPMPGPGISTSVWLDELGPPAPARRFGVNVTHYLVGFGPTLVSFRRGETEYGVKAFPLGGFIAMPGMYPPEPATTQRLEGQTVGASEAGAREAEASEAEAGTREEAAEQPGLDEGGSQRGGAGPDAQSPRRRRKGRLFESTMADAREFSNEEIAPGEEHRTFYALSVPKRLVVMFSGPFVNLVLGILIMAISLMGIGVMTPTTTVETVVECAVPASEAAQRSAEEQNTCR